MNQELVEKVAVAMCELGPLSTVTWEEIEDAGKDEYRSDAMAAIQTVGEHLLSELAGFNNACKMRAKIKGECGINE